MAVGFIRSRLDRWLGVVLLVLPAGEATAQGERREEVVRSAPGQYPSQRELADQERGWWLDLSAVIGFDSNPSLTPESDPRDAGAGGFAGTVASGFYRFRHSAAWSLYATGTAVYAYPFESPDFAVIAVRPTLAVDHRFQALGAPMAANFAYGLDAAWLGGELHNLGHVLSWSLRVLIEPFLVAVPSYTLSAIDFEEDGRDTVRHRLGLALRGPFRPLPFGRAEWLLDYGYTRNNAGDLHAYDEHAVAAGVGIGLRPGLLSFARNAASTLRFGLAYTHRDYTRYPTSPARREDTVALSADYTTPLYRQLFGSVAVVHRIGESNLSAFSTRRTTLTFALTWRF